MRIASPGGPSRYGLTPGTGIRARDRRANVSFWQIFDVPYALLSILCL